MHQLDLAGELAQHVDRVPAAALHPVHVDLEVQGRRHPAHDVEQRLAVVLGEVDVVVVVRQRDALGGQPLGGRLGVLRRTATTASLRDHRLERHHADPR